MNNNYKCSFCRRYGLKLWRPYSDSEPLICAKCAESRQATMSYPEVNWEKTARGYIGIHTGKFIELPKWKVDKDGLVPSFQGPGPNGLPRPMTSQLFVHLNDSPLHSLISTIMIPAIPYMQGKFWDMNIVPGECMDWWQALPTNLD